MFISILFLDHTAVPLPTNKFSNEDKFIYLDSIKIQVQSPDRCIYDRISKTNFFVFFSYLLFTFFIFFLCDRSIWTFVPIFLLSK